MPGQRHSTGRATEHGDRLVKALEERFTRLRQQTSGRRCRVPRELRESVLWALESGAKASAIRRACGVSAQQLVRWREEATENGGDVRVSSQQTAAVVAPPKVLEVVGPAQPQPGEDGPDVNQPIEVDLRFGDWQLCLRFSPAPTASQRDGQYCL